MRPRDIIMFFNACIAQAVDKPEVTVAMIRQAEGEYSRSRLRSLADEWSADYPNLIWAAGLLKQRASMFTHSEITPNEIADYCVAGVLAKFQVADIIARTAEAVVATDVSPETFWLEAVEMFYRVGLVGLKVAAYDKVQWSIEGRRVISSAEITAATRICIHPAFWRVLGVHDRRAQD